MLKNYQVFHIFHNLRFLFFMLVEKCGNCYNKDIYMGGHLHKMKQQVLKALANPSHLFFVPYTLAVLNFMVQFFIFIILYTIGMFVLGNKLNDYLNPLFLIISVCIVHMILAYYSRRDPQLGQILIAKIRMIKNRIPRRLAA